MIASETYILEDEQGNEYEIDGAVDPKVAAERIRNAPVVATSAATKVEPPNPFVEAAKMAAPVAADVGLTMLMPESLLMRLPGMSNIAKTIVSRWGPEMLRRLVGALGGTATAGTIGTVEGGPVQGLKSAASYGALSALPPVAAAQAEAAVPAATGFLGRTAARTVGGGAGAAGGTVASSLATRGELPSLTELGINTGLGAAGEGIAGTPYAFGRSGEVGSPWMSRTGIDPKIAELKKALPELADIPDAAFMDPSSWQRRLLDSFAMDPLLNPTIEGMSEDITRGLGQAARRELPGVRPIAERAMEPVSPILERARTTGEGLMRQFDAPYPTLPEPGMGQADVTAAMTQRLDAPRPPAPASILPPSTPTTVQQVGMDARTALDQRNQAIRAKGIADYEGMKQRVEAGEDLPLPMGPFEEASTRVREIAGRPVIPEGNKAAMRTTANVERAVTPTEAQNELNALFAEFPELSQNPGIGEGLEGALTGGSPVTTRQSPQLLKDLTDAKRRYKGRTNKAIIAVWEKAVVKGLEESGMPPERIRDILGTRAAYREMSQESNLIESTLRQTEKTPERLGQRIAKFNPEAVSPDAPRTLFSSMTKSGINVEEQARNILTNQIARDLSRATDKDIPKILERYAKSPLAPTQQLQTAAGDWRNFLANPANQGKAEEYFKTLVSGGDEAKVAEAMNFAKTLPQPVQEALGRMAARNILDNSLAPKEIVTGMGSVLTPTTQLAENLQKNMGALSLLPRDELKTLWSFVDSATAAKQSADKVADTIAKLYNPDNYLGVSNLFKGYFKSADPKKLAEVRDRLYRLGPDGQKMWEDFASSQLSTNMFHKNDFSNEGLISMFEDERGALVPRETLDVLTMHLPKSSQSALKSLYDASKRTIDMAPGRANPTMSALRTAASTGKTAADVSGIRTMLARVAPRLVLGGMLGAGSAATMGAGAVVGAGLSMGAMATAGLAPLVIGKSILSNGDMLRRIVTPAVQSLENAALQSGSAGREYLQKKMREKSQ